MAVTFFSTGITVTDGMASRLDAFSEAHFVRLWLNRHPDDDQPPGWPDPTPGERKALAEWGIKQLLRARIEAWENKQAIEAVETDPWAGGDVETASP